MSWTPNKLREVVTKKPETERRSKLFQYDTPEGAKRRKLFPITSSLAALDNSIELEDEDPNLVHLEHEHEADVVIYAQELDHLVYDLGHSEQLPRGRFFATSARISPAPGELRIQWQSGAVAASLNIIDRLAVCAGGGRMAEIRLPVHPTFRAGKRYMVRAVLMHMRDKQHKRDLLSVVPPAERKAKVATLQQRVFDRLSETYGNDTFDFFSEVKANISARQSEDEEKAVITLSQDTRIAIPSEYFVQYPSDSLLHQIRDALSPRESKLLLSGIVHTSVTDRHTALLDEGQQLNDSLVMFYLTHLVLKAKKPRLALVDSLAYPCFRAAHKHFRQVTSHRGFCDDVAMHANVDEVMCNADFAKFGRRLVKQRLFHPERRLVLWPVCMHHHWYLVVLFNLHTAVEQCDEYPTAVDTDNESRTNRNAECIRHVQVTQRAIEEARVWTQYSQTQAQAGNSLGSVNGSFAEYEDFAPTAMSPTQQAQASNNDDDRPIGDNAVVAVFDSLAGEHTDWRTLCTIRWTLHCLLHCHNKYVQKMSENARKLGGWRYLRWKRGPLLRFCSADVTRQSNLIDCGVFVMEYAQRLEKIGAEQHLLRPLQLRSLREWFTENAIRVRRREVRALIHAEVRRSLQKEAVTDTSNVNATAVGLPS
ncbi:MAG: hypothetical protein MHM6MM_001181 [Cercozoa sp. M6MM]